MKPRSVHPRPLTRTVLMALALGSVAHAASTLENYFDFTSYGTVAGGGTVTAVGNTGSTASVKSTATSLTSSGLAITAGTNASQTGVNLTGADLSGFTGDFSLQIWYTNGATIGNNTMLYGGTTSASQDNNLSGDQALFTGFGNTGVGVRPIASNSTTFGSAMAVPANAGRGASTTYDLVVTFDSTSKLFTAYLDGASVGTMTVASGFNGLSALANGFAIGGVQNPAFGDNAAESNITSFMMYTGALTSGEVGTIHGFGSTPTLGQLGSVVLIPEPSAALLGGLGILGLLRRRR